MKKINWEDFWFYFLFILTTTIAVMLTIALFVLFMDNTWWKKRYSNYCRNICYSCPYSLTNRNYSSKKYVNEIGD